MLKDKGKSGIYCWTSPSGKQYVGLAKNLEVRKRAFLKFYKDYTGGASKIDIARKKYNSKDKWSYEILEECSESELKDKEEYWINKLDSYYNGYNSTKGGHYDAEHRETAYKLLSEASKAMWERPGFREHQKEMYAKVRQKPEVIEHYRQATLNWLKTHDNPRKGAVTSLETKEKQRQAKLGGHAYHSMKPVVQLTENYEFIKEWPSIVDASLAIAQSKTSHIHSVCKGHRGTAFCYKWLFNDDYKDFLNGKPLEEIYEKYKEPKRTINTKKVYQYSTDGNLINIWNSISDAHRALTGNSEGTIFSSIDGLHKAKSSYGYYWLSEEKYKELKENYSNDELTQKILDLFKLPVYVPPTKKVLQISTDAKIINTFNSTQKANECNPKWSPKLIAYCCLGYTQTIYGYIWLYENDYNDKIKTGLTLKNIVKERLIQKEVKFSPVVQLSLADEYIQTIKSRLEVREVINHHETKAIINTCRCLQKQAYGYKWMYEDDYKEMLKTDLSPTDFLVKKFMETPNRKYIPVIQLTQDGEYVNRWNDMCEASMTFSGFPNSNIDKACKGIKKTCFGYKWMYLKDYEKIKG